VDSQFLLGPDVLVAPITTPGETGETRVWFPPGQWTDYFTGLVYQGNTWATVSAGLDTMPVFLRAGGMLVERSADVAHDVRGDALTVHVTAGASGSFTLHEPEGRTRIVQSGDFAFVSGPPSKRDWTFVVHHADGSSHVVRAKGAVVSLRAPR
jgi:alpha-glucosidase (family GH31 glycosyl hydrolase)